MAVSTPVDPIKNIGNDSTATFENDPKFTEPTPGSEGSSENVEEQARDTDDVEEDDDVEDEDVGDEDDDVDEDEEFDDDEDDDDEEDEDDEEEVGALRADGLLGYEDEADDAEKGRSEEQGNADRARAEAGLKNDPSNTRGTGRATDTDGDDDEGDIDPGVTKDTFTDEDMDTDRVTALPVDLLNWPTTSYTFGSYIGAQPTTSGTTLQ